jgi:hypothetical protein
VNGVLADAATEEGDDIDRNYMRSRRYSGSPRPTPILVRALQLPGDASRMTTYTIIPKTQAKGLGSPLHPM